MLAQIAKDKYDVIVMNYANADMVGHTGIIPAAIEAVEWWMTSSARWSRQSWPRRGGHCHRRPRQCRADDRTERQGSPYRAHHQSGADDPGRLEEGQQTAPGRHPGGHGADRAGDPWLDPTAGDDRAFDARGRVSKGPSIALDAFMLIPVFGNI